MRYRISKIAKEDLIRIHQFGAKKYGIKQADLYFEAFFKNFELIAERPFAFESVDFIKPGYRRCVCGVDTIYFRMNGKVVEIMTIIGKQDLSNL